MTNPPMHGATHVPPTKPTVPSKSPSEKSPTKAVDDPSKPGSAASDWDKEHEPYKVPQGDDEKAPM